MKETLAYVHQITKEYMSIVTAFLKVFVLETI